MEAKDTVRELDEDVKELHRKLTDCLNRVKLGVAGRFVYYDKENKVFILALDTTSPGKTLEAANLAWDSIPADLKSELTKAGIDFAGKQI